MNRPLRVAFVAGLSDKKLAQKLAPLQALPEIERIDLYRRRPFSGAKINWVPIPKAFRGWTLPGEVWRVMRLFQGARECDLVVGCHQNFHGVYAAVIGALWGVPVVQLVVSSLDWVDKVPLGRWALRRARAVGFRGYTSLRRYREETGAVPISFVIQNVWTPDLDSRDPSDRNLDLLYVGQEAPAKNLEQWLEVAAAVKRRLGRVRAAWVGELPSRRLRRRAKRLGMEHDLLVLGPRDGNALREVYRDAKVLLLTSRREGLPMVVVEAMAHGVPVVATRVGDVEELVKPGVTGFLTGAHDVVEATDAVCRLLGDPLLRHRLARGARTAFHAFAAQSTLEYTVAVWRDVLSRTGIIPVAIAPESSLGS